MVNISAEKLSTESCRVCLTMDSKLRSIYHLSEDGDTPNDMLLDILGKSYSKLHKKRGIPEKICRSCELSLGLAYQFFQKAVKTQELIALAIEIADDEESNLRRVCDVKNEVDSEDDYIVDIAATSVGDNDDDNADNNGQNTLHQGQTPDDEYIDQSNDGDILEYEEDFVDEGDDEGLYMAVDDENLSGNGDMDHLSSVAVEYLDTVYNDSDNEMVLCNELKMYERKPKCLKSSRILLSNKGRTTEFVCDICGNIYAKKSRMLEHRRIHNTSSDYACEMCDQHFSTREKLRKHMYAHTGTRPHKCKYCSRTFFYESVLRAHEGVHEGLKPYKCDECGRDFAYSHSLSKHKMIHADRKDYRCDYCDKDFRLHHHLKQHVETKLHKNRVQQASNMQTDMDEILKI